ncbi:MAG TPA: alpha/beta hydrolase [Thermoanaerobaculia bacterium]
MPDVLTVPGLWNSGPLHWQTDWEKENPSFSRVMQRDFDHPDLDEWVETLQQAVVASEKRPVLAAHSLGCALVAHWAMRYGTGVCGAFLVAPSDVEAATYPIDPGAFKPMPRARLPFPSIVVASTNDEYISLDRATEFANAWGSRLVNIGDAGHINGASGYGPWPQGLAMLEQFVMSLA